ncbi:MAG: hypothetical protein ACI8UO_004606 [Verrucomicrobiales bacterium]|jgi:uncharacterized protein (TIGR00251 family)
MTELTCRVTPNAKRSEILHWESDEHGRQVLRIKLNAPPVDGKANQQLLKFLGKTLGVPKTRLTIIRGEKSRLKTIAIVGMSSEELSAKIDQLN